jgi:nucleoid-associated protein YgaU
MNPDLLSAPVSMVFMAIVAAALFAHLSRITGPDRFLHAAYAATAAGLFYLFGSAAFGWSFIPREALFGLYALLFVAVVAVALIRRNATDVPVASLLIQFAGVAYMWAPENYWKPPLAALFLIYFVIETAGWVRGRQPARDADADTRRPPLVPPRPVRGVSEIALAGAAAAMVYVFGAGMGKAPVAATPPAEQASAAPNETAAAENDAAAQPEGAAESQPAPMETAAKEPEAAPAEQAAAPEAAPEAAPDNYTALAGDTLKSIARKLYGKSDKWRAIAKANPGLKPGARLKAGQVVALPEPPAKR